MQQGLFNVIETLKTSQGIEQTHRSVKFNKTYKNRFNKPNKKNLYKKKDLIETSTPCRSQEGGRVLQAYYVGASRQAPQGSPSS